MYASQLGIEVINVGNHLKNWKSENSQIPISIWETLISFTREKRYKRLILEKIVWNN